MKQDGLLKALNAIGTMAEVTLAMYRSAINAGATPNEAKDIVEAYFAATIASGKKEKAE